MAHLDSTHRCDGCGAQAYVELTLTATSQVLMFCGNHWRRNKHTLQDAGVWDDSDLLEMQRNIQHPVVPVDA